MELEKEKEKLIYDSLSWHMPASGTLTETSVYIQK